MKTDAFAEGYYSYQDLALVGVLIRYNELYSLHFRICAYTS
jgi:hypothetical protein